MPQASYVQSSFQSGEWSNTMQGRVDRPDYRQGMAVCFNGLPIETEGWTRRPGTIQAGFTRAAAAGCLIRFDFQESSPYNMEFTDGHLRFWSGLRLVTTNDDQTIITITNGTPAVVQTQQPHGWSTGDHGYFKSLVKPDGELLGRIFLITKIDSVSFSIGDINTGLAFTASDLSTISAIDPLTGLPLFAGGVFARVLDITSPYTQGSWRTLRSVQAEKKAVLLNGTTPQVLSLSTPPGPGTFATFALAAARFIDGPYLDPKAGTLATPSAKVGNITLTFSFQLWDATVSYSIGDYASYLGHNYRCMIDANLNIAPGGSPLQWLEVPGGDPHSPTGFRAGDIGRHIRLFSEPALWAVGTTYAVKDVVAFNNVYWVALASANTGNQPGLDASKWAVVSGTQYAIWSWGRITAISGGGIISGSLAGSVNIGNMTGNGGLAAAFDGTTAKSAPSCAAGATPAYVGKNYTGASAQIVTQATIYPSTDLGLISAFINPGNKVTVNLRAKQSAPASSADGTLLASTGSIQNTTTAITLASNDITTAWNYVWFEVLAASGTPAADVAQVVFFGPNVANGSVVTLQIAGPPLLYTSAIRVWRAGVYNNADGWPKCGTYHEGRLWLSGVVANRIDGSYANDIFNFAPTGPDGTVSAANALSYVFNAADVNTIFWMAPRQEGIVCGTQAGEWLIQASAANQPLTPFSIQAHRYTTLKCANIEPAQCEHTLAFVQKHKRRLIEYFADVFSGKFAAPNLTYKSQHITKPGIAEIRYQQDLMPVIWMRMANNTLAGLTYKRDSLVSKDGPTISAAHRHTLGSGRSVESMAVGPAGDEGDLEALSLVTADSSYRYVEVMGQIFSEGDALSSAQFVDGALSLPVYVDTGTSIIVYGLWAYNGIAVTFVCGGINCGQFTPTLGVATIPYGDGISGGTGNGLFTQAFVTAFAGAMPILAGFPYKSQGQLLRPHTPQESGARQGPAFGKVRRSHRVVALLTNVLSGALSFGTIFGKLQPAMFKVKNGATLTQTQLYTGMYKETLTDVGSDLDSQLAWEVTGTGPATVAAAGAFLNTEDE